MLVMRPPWLRCAMRNQRDCICLSFVLAGCISLPKVASGQSDAMPRVPTAIEECEKIGLTTNCATWQLNGKAFDARWPDGSIGRITMQQIPGHVVFEREDHSGASPGLTVTYYGVLSLDQITHGTLVQWMAGKATPGTWTATFVYPSKRRSN